MHCDTPRNGRDHHAMRVNQPEPAETDRRRLVPISEAASRVGLHPRRLRDAVRQGDLRAFAVGGWWRVRLEDVEDWLDNLRYRPETDG